MDVMAEVKVVIPATLAEQVDTCRSWVEVTEVEACMMLSRLRAMAVEVACGSQKTQVDLAGFLQVYPVELAATNSVTGC
jgi:hypothetical protein